MVMVIILEKTKQKFGEIMKKKQKGNCTIEKSVEKSDWMNVWIQFTEQFSEFSHLSH